MKKRLSWKKISAIGAGAVMAMSLAFGMGFSNLFANSSVNDAADGKTTQNVEGGGTNREVSSYAITQVGNVLYDSADTTKLGTFENGTTYWYTDYDLGVKLSGGVAGITTDRVNVTVNKTGNAAGTQLNPYVINSKEDWANFVAYMATPSANFGAGKYFVLNQDLDYENGNISLVEQFSGTFYGLGHNISNAIYNDLYSINEQTNGLFRFVTGDIYISDLSVLDYKMGTLTDSTQNVYGGIIGVAIADNVTVVGCTTKGVMEMNTTAVPDVEKGRTPVGNWSIVAGGILGCFEGEEDANLYFYKNTADVTGTIKTTRSGWPMLGGLIGTIDAWNYKYRMDTANFYDCYASAKYDLESDEKISNAFMGLIGFTRNVNLSTYRNCVFIADYKVNETFEPYSARPTTAVPKHYITLGLLTTIGEKRTTDTVGYQIDCQNFYGYGFCKLGTTKYALPLVAEYQSSGFTDVTNTFTNCNTFSGSDTVPATTNDTMPTADKPAADLDAWKAEAKGVLTNDNIWNPAVIDEINEPAAGSTEIQKPDITETPIVVSKTKITFNNVDDTALTLTDGDGNVREYAPNQVGVNLPTPTAQTGKEFVGWTLDKTSDANLLTQFPKNLNGKATVYPVYKMTGVSVNVTSNQGAGTDTTITKEYTGLAVTLTAALTLPAGLNASDCTITWSWFKDGTKIDGANTNTLSLTDLTSGTYNAKVKVVNSNVLWRTDPDNDVASTQSFDITISKGNLTPDGATTIDPAQKAYWGQALNQADNTLVIVPHMKNADGIEVAGTAVWNLGTTKVDKEAKTYTATFTPTDTTRYNAREIEVTITPTILKLKYAFDPTAVANTAFTFDIEYGAQFTGQELVDKFQPEYFAWLNEAANADAIGDNMPKFNGEYLAKYLELYGTQTRVQFNKAAIDAFTTEATFVLDVTFATPSEAPYTAQFFTNISGLTESTRNLYYGQKVPRPSLSQTGTAPNIQFLQGWFVANAAGEIQQDSESNDIPFDFDNTHVTENVYLAAKWIDGELRIKSISAVPAKGASATFTATTAPSRTDFTVTGLFEVYKNNVKESEVSILLSSDDYDLDYNNGGLYSVNSLTMTIRYAKTHTLSNDPTCTVDLTGKIIKKAVNVVTYMFTAQEATVPEAGSGEKRNITLASVVLDVEGLVQGRDYNVIYTYTKNGVEVGTFTNEAGGVDEIGTYFVGAVLDFSKGGTVNSDYRCDRKLTTSFEIKDKAKKVVVVWNFDGSTEAGGYTTYEYNGQVQHPTATFYLEGTTTRAPLYEGINFEYTRDSSSTNANTGSGYYRIGVRLNTIAYEIITDDIDHPIEQQYKIAKALVKVPHLAITEYVYKKGVTVDVSQSLGYTDDELLHLVKVEFATATDVPYNNAPIQTRVSLRSTLNSEWDDGMGTGDKIITWYLQPQQISVPTFQEGRLIYNGVEYQIKDYLLGYDAEAMVLSGDVSGKDAKTYRVNITLAGADEGINNYVWKDTFSGEVMWTIRPKTITLNWNDWNFTQSSSNPNQVRGPRIASISGLAEADRSKSISTSDAFVYMGDVNASAPGSYKIEADITSTVEMYKWFKTNYTISNGTKSLYWVIKGSANEVIIKLQWNLQDNGYYTFDGNVHAPTVIGITDERDMPLELDDYLIEYEGVTDKWAGTYNIKAVVASKLAPETMYRVVQENIKYRIIKNGTQGENPADQPNAGDNQTNNNDNQTNNNDNGATGDNPSNGFVADLPQIAISAVSAVLIVTFLIMAMNYSSAAKAAKQKAKKLAQISYSFAPFGLLVALGVSSSNWWIVAGVLMGLALLSAIVMFAMRRKAKKALAMLEEEQERIEDEKEMARQDREAQMREEQQRRDNELKMMFAAMQQNYQQPQMQYDDMRSLLAETVTALLPTMQQQMQALPPASQPSPEEDSLRAQMAAQQAQMAQQQALINELMQERQAAQQAEAAPAAASKEDDILSQFEPNEDGKLVSLEESYGKMSDDFKRYYYEIGCYIMERPNVVQNDGKYAVLFKYRSKTLFKLSIKNDATVLSYVFNNAKEEHKIISEAALAYAKQIVDMCIAQTDGKL